MSHRTVADDFRERSTTASADEERLLTLFRSSSWEDRSHLLYRLTRLHFVPFFAEHFSRELDARDSSYLHEELEEQLRLICPRHHLGSARTVFDETVLFNALWKSAWGDIAPVILGSDEHDGQRADELYQAVVAGCKEASQVGVDFQRMDALALIEDWREQSLQLVFSVRAEASSSQPSY